LSIEQIDPGARALREAVSTSITPMAWLLAGLYGLLIVIHPIALSGEHRWSMAITAGFSSALAVATALWWRKSPQPDHAHLVSAFLVGVALINTVLHFALFQQAANTTNFIILILGAGLIMLSRVSYYIIVTLAVLAWITIVNYFNVSEPSEWGWFLFFAVFVGSILEEQRIHATSDSRKREVLLLERSTALQNLVKSPALSDTNVTHILNLIAEAARVNLAASSVTIWLPEGDGQDLRLVAVDRNALTSPSPPTPQTLAISEEFTRLLSENRTVTSNPHAGRSSSGEDFYSGGQQPTLYVGIISSRHVAGVILVEREAKHSTWTLDDQMFAASIADLANLALQNRQRILLEGRARKAEHLESLGVLAGGVAHDFNNLLTVILGNLELMQESTKDSSETRSSLESMMEAGMRARDLAQQMLAYAGRAHRQTQTIDLASLGSDIDRVWAHDLLDGIDVAFDIDPRKVFPVDVDPTQIRQVVLNLLTNARDAGASRITISVGTDSQFKLSGDDSAAESTGYHWLEVGDNGSGMPAEEIERIFEPFYTTRESGTGLGLAASLGIMRAHLGALNVKSTHGEGSHFRILLPRSSKQPETFSTESPGELVDVSEQTKVLLIEDEPLVARLATKMLTQSGRQVEWLDSLSAFRRDFPSIDPGEIEFALIDVTLGDGSGLDAATALRQRRPDLPVILMSGYDARNALEGRRLGDSVEFLSKPFSRGALQASIDKAIGSSTGTGPYESA
jgi:signal transduction histidine kinase/CheY-like chemotaxis protein